jgi:hypothetical protein
LDFKICLSLKVDLESVAIFVSNFSETSELVPCFIFIRYLTHNPTYRILGFYFLFSAIIKIYTLITAELHIHNMPAFHFLALLEVLFLYTFYNRITFQTGPSIFVIIILVVASILDSFFIESIYQFNSIGWTFSIFFLLCLSLRYLYKLYQDLENIQLERNPLFIINTGFLVYFTGSLFTYIFGWEILSQEAKGLFHNAWIIQSFSNIFKNILISYGLWLARFRQTI